MNDITSLFCRYAEKRFLCVSQIQVITTYMYMYRYITTCTELHVHVQVYNYMYMYINTCTCLCDFTTHGDVPCTCIYTFLYNISYNVFLVRL